MKAAVQFVMPLFWFEKDTCCPGAKVAFLCAEVGDFRVCLGCKRILPCQEEVEA